MSSGRCSPIYPTRTRKLLSVQLCNRVIVGEFVGFTGNAEHGHAIDAIRQAGLDGSSKITFLHLAPFVKGRRQNGYDPRKRLRTTVRPLHILRLARPEPLKSSIRGDEPTACHEP